MKLLSIEQDAKTVKGGERGYLTGVMYLAPARESGVVDTCASSTAECRAACLYTAGRAGVFPAIGLARIARTRFWHEDPDGFRNQLDREIAALVKNAAARGLTPVLRPNGTSDLYTLARDIANRWSGLQCYDYTKHGKPWQRTSPNYHLTFSHSGHNLPDCLAALGHGICAAVVFSAKRGHPLPATWNGYTVMDGDINDLRFLDRPGTVVGLRAKGLARTQPSPFVVIQ